MALNYAYELRRLAHRGSVRVVNISGQKLALYGMTNLKVSVVTAKLLAHY